MPVGHPLPDRQIENLFGDFRMPSRIAPLPVRTIPGSGSFVAGAANLIPDKMENLLGAWLKNLGQNAARHHSGLPAADACDLHRFVRRPCRTGRSRTALDLSASGPGVRSPTAISLVK
jgi:hypothetical protein